jgi:acryloyl-coenzyme A reductase
MLSCAIGTGYHALRRAALRTGDTVVITGASGGVGLHTVKLAALTGLRPIAITSGEAKVERLREAGAAEVIVASDFAFHNQVRALTDGQGAAGVIEVAGVPTFASSLRSLRLGGRLVVVGNVNPGSVPLNPAIPILREIEIIGSGHATVSDLEAVVKLVARGAIAPEIAARFPLAEAAEAHRLMETRGTTGRVLLMHETGLS